MLMIRDHTYSGPHESENWCIFKIGGLSRNVGTEHEPHVLPLAGFAGSKVCISRHAGARWFQMQGLPAADAAFKHRGFRASFAHTPREPSQIISKRAINDYTSCKSYHAVQSRGSGPDIRDTAAYPLHYAVSEYPLHLQARRLRLQSPPRCTTSYTSQR